MTLVSFTLKGNGGAPIAEPATVTQGPAGITTAVSFAGDCVVVTLPRKGSLVIKSVLVTPICVARPVIASILGVDNTTRAITIGTATGNTPDTLRVLGNDEQLLVTVVTDQR